MPEAEGLFSSLVGSIRRLLRLVVELLRTRADLLLTELQEEKLRVVRLLVWVAVGMVLLMAGLLVVIGACALFLWERAGYAGLYGLAAVTLAAAAVVIAGIRHRIRNRPRPFAATMAELEKDLAGLKRPE